MSRPVVADFVDSFFTRILFQPDDDLAASVLSQDLAPDARITINGNALTSSDFTKLITTQFRSSFQASILEIRDLNVVTNNEAGSTGVVGQWTSYVTTEKGSGKELRQSATTIVEVEERDNKVLVTALYEAQTADSN